MHPYRELASTVEAPRPPKSKLPWILLAAGALHAVVLGVGAFAHPVAAASETASHGSTITVLGGHVDEATGDVALSGYQSGPAPKSYRQ